MSFFDIVVQVEKAFDLDIMIESYMKVMEME